MNQGFVRTVLGDVPASELGVCYAHEHVIIDRSAATERYPGVLLPSQEKAIEELRQLHADGGRAWVDSMPCDAGRNITKLAAIAEATRLHIVCPTGLHLAQYYPHGHWGERYTAEQFAGLFTADIVEGIDAHDYAGPLVERTPHRAGLIKVATEGVGLTDRERRIFEAAAVAHRRTGAPILTHTEQGEGALEQVEALDAHGVDLRHVVISHTDRRPDPAYHRDALQAGVRLEYDSAFRWKTEENPTLELVVDLLPDFPDQIVLGMDAARPKYWRSYGGEPGLSFLLTEFAPRLRERGLTEEQLRAVFVTTPADAYQFTSHQTG